MNKNPKISVVVPSLNSIKYIHECIDSILNQTLKDIEIICVDAGSTDGTLEVLREYEKNDNRLKVIVSDKKSYGYQMNLGIKEAKGEYLGIVESDDYIKQGMYEKLYDIAVKYACDVVKAGYCRFAYGKTEQIAVVKKRFEQYNLYNKVINPQDSLYNIFVGTNGLNPIGIYSLKFLQTYQIKLNETPGASYQDNGLWFQIFSFARRVYFVQDIFYMVRRDNPNSSIKNKEKVYCICDEYDFIRNFLRKNPSIEKKILPFCTLHRFGNYCFTLERIDEKYKLEFLKRWSDDFKKIQNSGEIYPEILGKNNLEKLSKIIENPVGYYYGLRGAVDRVKSQLGYRLGYTIVQSKTLSQLCMLPIKLFLIYKNFIFEKKVYNFLSKQYPEFKLRPIEDYSDYQDTLKVKKHLSYKIGNMVIYSFKKWYKGEFLILPFKLLKIYREYNIATEKISMQMKKDEKKETVVRNYDYYSKLSPSSYKKELELWFKQESGRDLNLENPLTINEKIQWLKLYDSTPLKEELTDKYRVRKWIQEKIGEKYLIPLIAVYDKASDIDFDILPERFVIKCNHGSGWVIIVRDKKTLNKDDVVNKLNNWMSKNYAFSYGLELHYKNIKPKIIIEEYIENKSNSNKNNSYTANEDLIEYKIMCFDGKCKYIWYTIDRQRQPKRDIYDTEWNKMPFVIRYPNLEKPVQKPEQLEEMLRLSEILSKGFCQVRVDWYILNDGRLKFGEMTFTSESGMSKFIPEKWDEIIGKMCILPKK
ncbi:glycosyltransferase, family 2 (ATP grasp domain) [Campylobacter lari]|uniref:ATP-grasp fold amidoligase family protein n=1 Tax=Campylobacter lari TaxID=201 RepID=UPI00397855FC